MQKLYICDVDTGAYLEAEITPVLDVDYASLTKRSYFFDWKAERGHYVYKLRIRYEAAVLGLISLENIPKESRVEIRLLAVSSENRGSGKKYEHIVGQLICFACKFSLKQYGEFACVSLIPKTELAEHYMKKYNMLQAGVSLFLDGPELLDLINFYDHVHN